MTLCYKLSGTSYVGVDTIDTWLDRGLVVVRGIHERAQQFFGTIHDFRCGNNNVIKNEVRVLFDGTTGSDACKRTNYCAFLRRCVRHDGRCCDRADVTLALYDGVRGLHC